MLIFEENEKPSPALQCQTEQEKNTLTNSIAQSGESIPALGIDSFIGTVRDFRSYLKAQMSLINAGVIAP